MMHWLLLISGEMILRFRSDVSTSFKKYVFRDRKKLEWGKSKMMDNRKRYIFGYMLK